MGYFDNKNEMARKAMKHSFDMEQKYPEQIKKCSDNSYIIDWNTIIGSDNPNYYNPISDKVNTAKPKVSVVDSTTTDYIFSTDRKCVVLNFASFKEPGGMFFQGSSAQEESLCHESILYNVLSRHKEYYSFNKKHLNNNLYMDRALISNDVIFERGDCIKHVDVITCAAPNLRYLTDDFVGISVEAIRDRIKFVLAAATHNAYVPYTTNADNTTLVLGAFGCGVFANKPEIVAMFFKYLISLGYADYFSEIVFAIPAKYKNAYDTFRYTLSNV